MQKGKGGGGREPFYMLICCYFKIFVKNIFLLPYMSKTEHFHKKINNKNNKITSYCNILQKSRFHMFVQNPIL